MKSVHSLNVIPEDLDTYLLKFVILYLIWPSFDDNVSTIPNDIGHKQ